jgi:pyruvate/2-oxoglutarate dehydrogenase complex dihydrolipoamide acyltransferase (E2) component
MKYEVKLPDLGDDAGDEATVSYWLVEEGDEVTEADDLVEMTTDKAAFSIPCPKSGVVVEKVVEEGDDVSVGDVICILEI